MVHEPTRDTASSVQVPEAAVGRLSLYLRELQRLLDEGIETVSSTQLGRRLGFSDAQVRKDLAHFGHFGYPGIGYRCLELSEKVKTILGTNRSWVVVLVGVGNLGRALLRYRGFEQQSFRIAAALDIDPQMVGSRVEGIPVFGLELAAEVIKTHGIRLAIVCVPSPVAQSVVDQLVEAGIEGVLNFAPITISLPKHVRSESVDLAIQLEQLSFAVVNKEQSA